MYQVSQSCFANVFWTKSEIIYIII